MNVAYSHEENFHKTQYTVLELLSGDCMGVP